MATPESVAESRAELAQGEDRLVWLGLYRPEPQELGLVYVPFEHDPGEDFRRGLYYTWGDSDLF